MKLHLTALLVAVPAVIAGLLVATPAQAASYNLFVATNNVAISPAGHGKVYVSCHSSSTCRGKLSFVNDTSSPRERAYSMGGGKSGYVSVAMHTGSAANPQSGGTPVNGQYSYKDVKLTVNEDSPRNTTHHYKVRAETLLSSQQITGHINGQHMTKLNVQLIRVVRGGNTQVVRSANVTQGDTYSFSVSLGNNNSASSPFRLRISGIDKDDNFRSWFWRGSDDAPSGGGRYLREASTVQAHKTSNFDADFNYSSIDGTAPSGAQVTVAAPPPSFPSGSTLLRELDIPSCADIFGETRSSSGAHYRVDFLPTTTSTNDRYMIGVKAGSAELWHGKSQTARYGSCYDATNYTRSKHKLITLTGPLTHNFGAISLPDNSIKIDGSFSSAFKSRATAQGDRWISLREKIPGLAILDTPIVREHLADSGGNYRFNHLRPGKYWVEVGRRTGCSDWYPSRYPNNASYFKGADRHSEIWKSFTKLSHLPGDANSGYELIARTARPNPATNAGQNHIPGGYAGWMYRGYCKAFGAGSINTVNVDGDGKTFTFSTSVDHLGAVVHGHVSRSGGRTNKEMMVRLSSAAGTRVIRTDLTDGGGNFYIAGLPSGNWTISVNSDSWRGISRTFTGRHSITVTAGHTYGVGTLSFRDNSDKPDNGQ